MKKHAFRFLALLLGVTLLCALPAGATNGLSEVGVAPYPLTEQEEYLLGAFGLDDIGTQIISFIAPPEALSVVAHVYTLGADGAWEVSDEGGMYAASDASFALQGVFTMRLAPDYAIDFIIQLDEGGRASYTGAKVEPQEEILGSTWGFLTEFTEITLEEEIPVAILGYHSSGSISGVAPEDFFDPSAFEGMDLARAVTLTFSAKE